MLESKDSESDEESSAESDDVRPVILMIIL